MKTLCMDTSHRFLVLVLMENDQIKASFNHYAWKKQSETIFVELMRLMDGLGWKANDLDEVVITRGPGSYTGVRIAMSIAKVLCSRKKLKLYTISTLQLYAGLQECSVILDARSNRVYYGKYKNGQAIEESIKTIDEIKALDETYIGDLSVLGEDEYPIEFDTHFQQLRPYYKEVKNIHSLIPTYLKEESAYLVKS